MEHPPTEGLTDAELFEKFGHLINYRSPAHKLAFKLRCDELTFAAIAKETNLSQKTIRNAVNEATADLFKLLQHQTQQVSELQAH